MPEDQRRHLRLPVNSSVFIELVSPGVGCENSGKIAICSTPNASRGGLRVDLDQALVVGAILQIGVELPKVQDTLYLAGEVRWCQANQAHGTGWSAGFALLDSSGSDIDRWVALVAEMEN